MNVAFDRTAKELVDAVHTVAAEHDQKYTFVNEQLKAIAYRLQSLQSTISALGYRLEAIEGKDPDRVEAGPPSPPGCGHAVSSRFQVVVDAARENMEANPLRYAKAIEILNPGAPRGATANPPPVGHD